MPSLGRLAPGTGQRIWRCFASSSEIYAAFIPNAKLWDLDLARLTTGKEALAVHGIRAPMLDATALMAQGVAHVLLRDIAVNSFAGSVCMDVWLFVLARWLEACSGQWGRGQPACGFLADAVLSSLL